MTTEAPKGARAAAEEIAPLLNPWQLISNPVEHVQAIIERHMAQPVSDDAERIARGVLEPFRIDSCDWTDYPERELTDRIAAALTSYAAKAREEQEAMEAKRMRSAEEWVAKIYTLLLDAGGKMHSDKRIREATDMAMLFISKGSKESLSE